MWSFPVGRWGFRVGFLYIFLSFLSYPKATTTATTMQALGYLWLCLLLIIHKVTSFLLIKRFSCSISRSIHFSSFPHFTFPPLVVFGNDNKQGREFANNRNLGLHFCLDDKCVFLFFILLGSCDSQFFLESIYAFHLSQSFLIWQVIWNASVGFTLALESILFSYTLLTIHSLAFSLHHAISASRLSKLR